MIELSKVIEELKIIKNDLRDLPARRLKLIDLLINKYEHLSTSNDMKESRTLLAEQEDREELMAEALNPLGSYKLVPEKDPGMDIYPVQPELDFKNEELFPNREIDRFGPEEDFNENNKE